MVIHKKEKAKIHTHEPKKASIKAANIYTVDRSPKIKGAAIATTENKLSKDVEIQRMEKKWDELYEQTHSESVVDSIQTQPIALVSKKEYEYGADAFEAYMKESKGEIKNKPYEVYHQKWWCTIQIIKS